MKIKPQRPEEFIDFMLSAGVLRFGEFVGKSGREMPYFLDAGRYRTGNHLRRLGSFYADCIQDNFGSDFDVLFGPAYKGIPLVVAAAEQLASRGHDCGFVFDRKEIKDHGEGGFLIGHPLWAGARIVIVEDVTTAGTSIRHSVAALRAAADVKVVGLVVAVDRRERGLGEQSALAELEAEFGIRAAAITDIEAIIAHAQGVRRNGEKLIDDALEQRIRDYRLRFGAPPPPRRS